MCIDAVCSASLIPEKHTGIAVQDTATKRGYAVQICFKLHWNMRPIFWPWLKLIPITYLSGQKFLYRAFKSSSAMSIQHSGCKKSSADQNYRQGFVLRTAPRYHGTMRVFEEPHEGLAWVQAQRALDEGAVVAAIQLYSDSMLKAPYSARMAIRNITTVGYFPPLEILRPSGFSDVRWRIIKVEILHACMHVLLQPLKQLSWSGSIMPDPSRQRHNVYPRLLSDVGDDPEVHDHACIFSTAKAQMPRAICECPREQLNRIDKQFPLRTVQTQESRRAEMLASSTGVRAALTRRYSQHPVKSGLLGFAGQDLLQPLPNMWV